MSDVVRYLTSLAQALAKMSLYADGHPARGRAADSSFQQLKALQVTDPRPAFSFLGQEVVYDKRTVRDLQEWDWARKLSAVGIQRLEFEPTVDREEYHAFLEGVLARMPQFNTVVKRDARHTGSSEAIRFGAVGVRGAAGDGLTTSDNIGDFGDVSFDLTEEADAVAYLHDEIMADSGVALVEAEAVVHSLAAAMHAGHRVFLPLLTLKEFDQYTTTHALNVSVLAMALSEYLGLSARESRVYGMTGLLHDLGKVKVPIDILRKPGVLTPEEQAIMRGHTTEGAKLILESDKHLDICATVAFEHHIMIDGGGYPVRHRKCACHNASLLVHVCDVFDALRTHRPYRVAWETAAVLDYIEKRIGTEFDPTAATAFVSMMREREIRVAHADSIDGIMAEAAAA